MTQKHSEMIPDGLMNYINVTHFCDYTSEIYKSVPIPVLARVEDVYDEEKNALVLKKPEMNFDMEFRYKGDEVYLYVKTSVYECEIKCSGGNRVMWMQDTLGIEGFIREGAENDRSFYYSLPKLPFTGWIKYTDNEGKEVLTDVYGQGWIDRQWGNFMTKTWEWTSFRFADGDRVNTYNFGNGYQVCTYQKEDGTAESFDKFKVVQNGYARTSNNIWFSYGWDYTLPVKENKYHLVPLSNKNVLESEMNSFFEGLSKVIDESGNQVGWAVTESMDVREMHNAPYEIFNNFPNED